MEFALPRELNQAQGIELAQDFVQAQFVDAGMIADLNVHWDIGEDGMAKPHAHVMLTMRSVDETRFGPKVRDWNSTQMIERWRERWAELANERLSELDIDARIDHRSLEAQGIELEPQSQIGASAQRIETRSVETEALDVADRAELHREIARNNGARILADAAVALDAITQQQSTFTRRDLALFAHRHSDGLEQFNAVMNALESSPVLVALGSDGRGMERFTTRDMIAAEQRLYAASERMAERRSHGVDYTETSSALASAQQRGLLLSGEQQAALSHITDGRDLALVIGHAGTGKSAMLGVAREAWEAAGYRVRGAALSGIAAENLEGGSGIASRTVASMEHGWQQGRDLLSARDVLIIDEAGMVGTRQMERVLSHASESGAKIVLVGDPQQLQAIEAGAALRSLHERHGGAEIGDVRRQHDGWQRDATRDLATARIGSALEAYRAHDMVHEAASREQAREDLIERWDRERQLQPDQSRIILTHTNDEVRLLNEAARERMRTAGDLGDEVRVTVDRRMRHFASGDRVMFLQNERGLGVKNGTLGTIEMVDTQSMTVRTDDGRSVAFEFKDYDRLDHGYAATIHKAQGMTVDRSHVLATPGLDAHGAYVALSRHREGVDLHYGSDDFANPDRLARTLSRDRSKDMVSDYDTADPARLYAERRGITFTERVAEIIKRILPERLRERIGGLLSPGQDSGRELTREHANDKARRDVAKPDINPARDPEALMRKARTDALTRHARAVDAILVAGETNDKVSPDRLRELDKARQAFDKVRPHGWRDAEAAYAKHPELAHEAATGKVNRAIRALQLETEIRIGRGNDASLGLNARAERFVERWQKLDQSSQRQYQAADMAGYRATRSQMGDMAKSLERDPQLESILANHKKALGIGMETGRRLGAELAFSHGIDLGRGRGVGL